MQLHGTQLTVAAKDLWKDGRRAWYRGLSASSFRQATYGGMRLSIYKPIRNAISRRSTSASPDFQGAAAPPAGLETQLLAGALSGALSAGVMCPADVVKIRLQAGEAQYKGVSDALISIIRHEGVANLWRGVGPTSTRASVVAAAELGLYDATKQWLIGTHGCDNSAPVYMVASILATTGAIALSFPLDVAKTVMINQGVQGVATAHSGLSAERYRSLPHCVFGTFEERGFFGMYRGAAPSLARQLVCNSVMFCSYEHLKKLSRKI